MYVEPNSTIRLCNNVPLDPDYTDTLYFANATDQYNYFVSKSSNSLVYNNNSYVKKEIGVIRLQASVDSIKNCNYMMYRNTSHENMWFYAFIDRIEYVNELNTYIHFTIDSMQTYFFKYTVDACMIERMHTLTDNIGDNIVPDITNGGEYVMNTYNDIYSTLLTYGIVVQWVNPNTNEGWLYDNCFGAAELLGYGMDEIEDVQAFIDSQAAHPDSIQGIYMCPLVLMKGRTGGARIPSETSPFNITVDLGGITDNVTLNGYAPKNNKMFTYPYNFYHIDEPSGGTLDLRYEFFNSATYGHNVRVKVGGNVSFPVELSLMPVGYKGSGDNIPYRSERLSIKGFPMCSYATDAYAAWMAQNSVPMALKVAGNAGQFIAHPFSSASSAALINSVADVVSQGYQASIAADVTKGSFSTGNNDFSNDRLTFWGGRMSLNQSDAKIIDDFFTMYGYAIKRYGIPMRHNRQRFTYVKTVGVNVHGYLPADDAKKIADIYNNGIRFWADTQYVGIYALGNPVL